MSLASPARADKPTIAVESPVLFSSKIDQSAMRTADPWLLVGPFEQALRGSRRFTVLTRRDALQARVAQEQALANSPVYAGDGAQFGGKQTAQYLVALIVHDLRLERDEDPIPELNRYRRIDIADLSLEVQVVQTDSDELIGTYSVSERLTRGPKMVAETGGRADVDLLQQAATKASREVVQKFLDNVFPMKVARASGDTVWINFGGEDAVSENEVLEVYGAGEPLLDPDTGEKLGVAEAYKGRVRIEQVNPKFSIATVLSTNAPIKVGDILRRTR
ncbi:hypothetical protein [Rhodovibrio salinarum]|uniref:Curli production assembly/transport component CsgG n=1 Tax=Rhodovibrio salinarum TaxID=1087 RepID=A0A934V116_9PROT|nr:hypothetical protein [Rhodovibrio salinarum]MBK1698231.1 hypothetical protein [Rhodovibrio salinarum]